VQDEAEQDNWAENRQDGGVSCSPTGVEVWECVGKSVDLARMNWLPFGIVLGRDLRDLPSPVDNGA
jgi:hypothetical protein